MSSDKTSTTGHRASVVHKATPVQPRATRVSTDQPVQPRATRVSTDQPVQYRAMKVTTDKPANSRTGPSPPASRPGTGPERPSSSSSIRRASAGKSTRSTGMSTSAGNNSGNSTPGISGKSEGNNSTEHILVRPSTPTRLRELSNSQSPSQSDRTQVSDSSHSRLSNTDSANRTRLVTPTRRDSMENSNNTGGKVVAAKIRTPPGGRSGNNLANLSKVDGPSSNTVISPDTRPGSHDSGRLDSAGRPGTNGSTRLDSAGRPDSSGYISGASVTSTPDRPSSALARGIKITEFKENKVNPTPIVLEETDLLLEDHLSSRKLVCNPFEIWDIDCTVNS